MATLLRTRATYLDNVAGTEALLTYYWDSTGGTPTAVMTEAVARVRSFWVTFRDHFPNSGGIELDPVGDEVDEVTGAIVSQYTAPAVSGLSGLAGGDALPPLNQGLLRLRTGTYIGGRRVLGRQFIPGAVEADSQAGRPAAGYVSALNTAAAALGATQVTAIAQRVWHRPVNGSGGLSVVITARSASSEWAVLRSRR